MKTRTKCHCITWLWCLGQHYCERHWMRPNKKINWKQVPSMLWHKRAFYIAFYKRERSKHKLRKQLRSHNVTWFSKYSATIVDSIRNIDYITRMAIKTNHIVNKQIYVTFRNGFFSQKTRGDDTFFIIIFDTLPI